MYDTSPTSIPCPVNNLSINQLLQVQKQNLQASIERASRRLKLCNKWKFNENTCTCVYCTADRITFSQSLAA